MINSEIVVNDDEEEEEEEGEEVEVATLRCSESGSGFSTSSGGGGVGGHHGRFFPAIDEERAAEEDDLTFFGEELMCDHRRGTNHTSSKSTPVRHLSSSHGDSAGPAAFASWSRRRGSLSVSSRGLGATLSFEDLKKGSGEERRGGSRRRVVTEQYSGLLGGSVRLRVEKEEKVQQAR